MTLALTPEMHAYFTSFADAYNLTTVDDHGKKFVRWSELFRALMSIGVTEGGEWRARVAFALSQHVLMAVSQIGRKIALTLAKNDAIRPDSGYLPKRNFYLSTLQIKQLRFMQRLIPGGKDMHPSEVGMVAVQKGLNDPDMHRIMASYAVESNRLKAAIERAEVAVGGEVGRIQEQWSISFKPDSSEVAA